MVIFFNKATRSPWEGKASIYAYIRDQGEHVGDSLPDDEEYWSDSPIRWVAGGMDGALGHHAGSSDVPNEAHELANLLAKHSRKPNNSTRKELYARVVTAQVGGMMDAILDEVRKHPGIQAGVVFDEARWFVEHAAHRNVVKFGIALLGLFQNEQVKELLLTLGRHEEFTLYSAVAIQNGMEDSNEVLFELAQHVHGWGKINLVERLEPNTTEIKDWLLRHGCQNSIMNEYLACICARNGDLREALVPDQVDRELFEGASTIIEALLYGGPAEDIDDYEHAPQVLSDYVRLSGEMCSTTKHLSVMLNIRDFLDQDEEKWEGRMSAGWTAQARGDIHDACQFIIGDSKWSSLIMDAVSSNDSQNRYYGVACAEKLGMDIWETLYSQLAVNPLQDAHYLQLMKSNDPARIQKLVHFATEHLPLPQIATGPGDEMGFGKEYEAHRSLDTILQSLDSFEGMGKELILTGLKSPVIRNRNMAIMALEGWNVASWGDQLIKAVIHLSGIEPDDSVKERLQQLRTEKEV
ncbi:limonene hydroxylase [Paenibacillus guangzhouensis]|uniref:limonene hydroxylase n=1 Tax=Paenibacillus guangzhouensis TaxID=1473112 RepID=UPI0012672297|nr:limonene hydroxylase [Paenibacillus guangzhouensis]